jgi:hypothetical protein
MTNDPDTILVPATRLTVGMTITRRVPAGEWLVTRVERHGAEHVAYYTADQPTRRCTAHINDNIRVLRCGAEHCPYHSNDTESDAS